MGETGYLTNQFLIAMPNLLNPDFFHSVTYICEHNQYGAMGIVINQPVALTVGELIEQMEQLAPDDVLAVSPVFRGGPMDVERGFVLHQPVGDWESTLSVADNIGITTSNDIIKAMAEGCAPPQCLVALGYAGWGPGQIEVEICDNAWLNGPADPQILFNTPVERRWEAAAALIGVDIHQLTGAAGHA
jgi:putative transcriptional regulator